MVLKGFRFPFLLNFIQKGKMSQDSKYKLTYFDLRALGEPIRLMFVYKKIEFENDEIDYRDWPAIKPRIFGGYLPQLEVDGRRITSSVAISRFLAKRFDLMPECEWNSARCDEVVDAIQDLRIHVMNWNRGFIITINHYNVSENYFSNFAVTKDFIIEEDLEKKETVKTNLMKEIVPCFLSKLNVLVSQNKGPFICGEQITWADFWLSHFCNTWEELFDKNILSSYEVLKVQKAKVWSIPQIKEWNEKRPKTFV